MRENKTKGKQIIEIKKVEKNEERMVTFSKRRSGIYTKLGELSILCGADVGFLVYSGAGKPYTFGSPSFDAMAEQFLNGDHPLINNEGSSSSSIIDAQKKVKMDELCKTVNNMKEEAEAEEERGKKGQATSSLPVESNAWWKVDPKNNEEAKQLLENYEQFYEKLCEVAAVKNRGKKDASAF